FGDRVGNEGDRVFRYSPGDEMIAHRLSEGDDGVGGRSDLDLLVSHESEASAGSACGTFGRAVTGGRPRLLKDTADLIDPGQPGCGCCRSRGQAVDVVRRRVEDLSAAVLCLCGDPARLVAQTSSRCGL